MNVAIAGRWGEQPNPIGPTAGRAGLAIEELNAAGVPLDFTLAQIPDAIGRATIDAPPKSFRYVVPGIIERWRESGEATLITSATGDRLGVQRLAARWFAFLVRTGWYLLNAGQQEEMLSDESARPWPLGELTVEEIRRDWPLVGRVAADVMQSTRGEIEGVRRIAQALTAEPWRATG